MAKLEEQKACIDSTGAKSANLKDKILFYILVAFSITSMERQAAKSPCTAEVGRLK